MSMWRVIGTSKLGRLMWTVVGGEFLAGHFGGTYWRRFAAGDFRDCGDY